MRPSGVNVIDVHSGKPVTKSAYWNPAGTVANSVRSSNRSMGRRDKAVGRRLDGASRFRIRVRGSPPREHVKKRQVRRDPSKDRAPRLSDALYAGSIFASK